MIVVHEDKVNKNKPKLTSGQIVFVEVNSNKPGESIFRYYGIVHFRDVRYFADAIFNRDGNIVKAWGPINCFDSVETVEASPFYSYRVLDSSEYKFEFNIK